MEGERCKGEGTTTESIIIHGTKKISSFPGNIAISGYANCPVKPLLAPVFLSIFRDNFPEWQRRTNRESETRTRQKDVGLL